MKITEDQALVAIMGAGLVHDRANAAIILQGYVASETEKFRTALLDVMDTERLRDLAHQKWQSAQEDKRVITASAYEKAKQNNSSACAAHHDALNKARALLTPSR